MSGRSSCPECGTILRIRDRSFVGRRVNCPECKTALRIDANEQQTGFVTHRLTAAELADIKHAFDGAKGGRKKTQSSAPPAPSFMRRLIDSPLTAAWLLAIAISSLVAVLTLAPKSRFNSARPIPAQNGHEPSVEPVMSPTPEPNDSGESLADTVNSLPPETARSDSNSVSALEPVNIDGPLPWPPDFSLLDIAHEPTVVSLPIPIIVDVESKLMQKLVSYKQSKPVSRRDLIEALQEHLGAPIRYDNDELGASNLDQTVTFDLEHTTVGGVIKAITDSAGWEFNIEATGLKLTRKQSPPGFQ